MAATTKDGREESKIRGRESSHSVVTGSQVRDNDDEVRDGIVGLESRYTVGP